MLEGIRDVWVPDRRTLTGDMGELSMYLKEICLAPELEAAKTETIIIAHLSRVLSYLQKELAFFPHKNPVRQEA